MIGRAAELHEADVVLEVGGGLGVLSEYLAPRVAHLHVVEVDRSLEPPLRDALEPFANASLHLADAVTLDLAALEPRPTKVVANLPYGVAATVLLKAVEELPGATLFVAMVQREVGERLAAAPGGKTYGATSVLAQLACDVKVLRRVPRTVFHPEPNVESALVALRRTGPAAAAELSELVHAAFAHRRKALAGSLALAPGAPERVRERARAALAELGHPADARAERLSPEDFRRLEELLAVTERAPAKVNLVLRVGPPGADGLHALASLFASLDLADEVTIEEAERDEVICPGVEGENLAARALEAFRDAGGDPPAAARHDREAHPCGRRAGRRKRRRRRGPARGAARWRRSRSPCWRAWRPRSAATCRASCAPATRS